MDYWSFLRLDLLLLLREDVVWDLDLLIILHHGLDSCRLGHLSELVVPEADLGLIVDIGKALVLYKQ